MSDEYDPDGRFAWDMIELTERELNQLCDYADAGMFDEAEAVVDRAEDRLFGKVA
jgi:hypothetical protein